jgi:hypothetical protein
MTRPLQDLLARLFDACRRPRDGDGQFIARRPKFGFLGGLPNLRNDLPELSIGSRERQRALGLDFERRIRPIGVLARTTTSSSGCPDARC